MKNEIYDLKRMLLEIESEEIKERIQETARLATLVDKTSCILKMHSWGHILEDNALKLWDEEIEMFLARKAWYE